MTTYGDYLAQLRASATSAYEYIPLMCNALREEDPHLSNEDIKDRVTKDALEAGLTKSTITHSIPEEFKNPESVKKGKKGAEKKKELIAVSNTGEQEKVPTADDAVKSSSVSPETPKMGSSESQKENTQPSFSNAADLIPKVGRKEFYEEPLEESVSENVQNIIKEKDEEIARIKTELLELREAVTKTSFKPAAEVKSFSFNDLPTPDNMNTFVFKKIKFPDLRNQLVILSARGGRLLNAYLERAD